MIATMDSAARAATQRQALAGMEKAERWLYHGVGRSIPASFRGRTGLGAAAEMKYPRGAGFLSGIPFPIPAHAAARFRRTRILHGLPCHADD